MKENKMPIHTEMQYGEYSHSLYFGISIMGSRQPAWVSTFSYPHSLGARGMHSFRTCPG